MVAVKTPGVLGVVLGGLAEALSREVLRGRLGAHLARHGGQLEALADVPDVPTLLARLDAAPPFSSERDALLADLMRLHLRTRDGAALGALVYALHGLVARRGLRFVAANTEAREGLAELVYVLLERIDAFDVDARSRNTRASIERDVLRDLARANRREQLRQGGCVELDDDDERLSFTPELPELHLTSTSADNDTGPVDSAVVGALLQPLVARRILRERDALIYGRVELLGQRAVDVARELGMKPDATRKALERARASLRRHRAQVETILMSRLRARVAL